MATFARDDPSDLELLHFFLKIHRLHLIALDRCEWPRTSPTSRAVGLSPFQQLGEARHLWLSVYALDFLSEPRVGPEAVESRLDRFCHSLLDPLHGSLLRREVKVHVVDDVVRRFGNSVNLTWNLIFCARLHSSFSSFTVVSSTFMS